MKKILKITAISLAFTTAFTLAACNNPISSGPDASLKKPTKDQLVQDAASKCQTLGFDPGTKEFRDCTVTQFNKMQDKYY